MGKTIQELRRDQRVRELMSKKKFSPLQIQEGEQTKDWEVKKILIDPVEKYVQETEFLKQERKQFWSELSDSLYR